MKFPCKKPIPNLQECLYQCITVPNVISVGFSHYLTDIHYVGHAWPSTSSSREKRLKRRLNCVVWWNLRSILTTSTSLLYPPNQGRRSWGGNILQKGPCINRAPPIIKLQHVLPCQSVMKIMHLLFKLS